MEIEVTSELHLEDGRQIGVSNHSAISTAEVARDPAVQGLVREISRWVRDSRSVGANQGMFDRNLYQPPDSPYDQMRVARRAVVDDDIVGGVADITQSFAFQGGHKWECTDPDVADVFNQLGAVLNLDESIRAMWRDTFSVDQFVCARMWGWQTFKVRGTTGRGNRRKSVYRVWAPTRLVMLDPTFVVPIGWGPLREDRLAWMITQHEISRYETYFTGLNTDLLMQAFFRGFYQPGPDEATILSRWGVIPNQLVEMDPGWVFRHCHVRPDYQMFPDIRLRSVFSQLDLKRQQLQADRASLIGIANYILLIRKGDKDTPATGEEIGSLRQNYCVDEETQIFTQRGWVNRKDLMAGKDRVLSLNQETGMSEWDEVTGIYLSDEGEHEVVKMEGRSHHSISTPNHRWLVQNEQGKWRFRTTETLNTCDRVPYNAPRCDLPQVAKYDDDLVELAAWYYTEGSHPTECGAEIFQSEVKNSHLVKRIRGCLERLYGESGKIQARAGITEESVRRVCELQRNGVLVAHAARLTGLSSTIVKRIYDGGTPPTALWSEHLGPSGIVTFRIGKEKSKELSRLAPDKVPSPEFLTSLTGPQLDLFIEVSLLADGANCLTASTEQFSQSEKARSDAFEMACILAGRSVRSFVTAGGMHYVDLLVRKHFIPVAAARKGRKFSISSETLHGRVWCPTVKKNGTWLAKSKGSVFFTGNSFMARIPVIISDHRLQIDIIAPKQDFVLKSEHYEVLDSRILMRTLNAFLPPGVRTFDAPTWTSQMAAGIQDRRHMIKRTLEREVAMAIINHPRNAGVFDAKPSLVFTPRNVAVGDDSGMLQALLALRTQHEISRDTLLEHVGLDQATEALRLQEEDKRFDGIFQNLVPYGSPDVQPNQGAPNGTPEPPQVSGGRGGRPKGGGESPKSPEAIAKPKAPSGNPSTKESK